MEALPYAARCVQCRHLDDTYHPGVGNLSTEFATRAKMTCGPYRGILLILLMLRCNARVHRIASASRWTLGARSYELGLAPIAIGLAPPARTANSIAILPASPSWFCRGGRRRSFFLRKEKTPTFGISKTSGRRISCASRDGL